MEGLGIFATQDRSAWCQNMIQQSKNDMGHEDQSWATRAMIAFEPAGLEGRIVTANEIEDAVVQYVGFPEYRTSVGNVIIRAMKRGIMRKTGRKKYVDGVRNPYPEYEIVGHIEIDSDTGGLRPIRMRENAAHAG